MSEPKSVPDALHRAAVHEIGHAAVAVLLGRTVRHVSVHSRPETVLESLPLPRGKPKTDADRALLEGELMLTVAGVAAERVCGVARDVEGALDDLGKAAAVALRLSGSARAEATVQHFLSVVERLLAGRKDRLAVAARELVSNGRLDGPTVTELLPRSG